MPSLSSKRARLLRFWTSRHIMVRWMKHNCSTPTWEGLAFCTLIFKSSLVVPGFAFFLVVVFVVALG